MYLIILETPAGEVERVTAPDGEEACIAAATMIMRRMEMRHGDTLRVIDPRYPKELY